MTTTTPNPTRKTPFEVGRLVERAADGDRDAWNELVDEFSGLVWALARSHRPPAPPPAQGRGGGGARAGGPPAGARAPPAPRARRARFRGAIIRRRSRTS